MAQSLKSWTASFDAVWGGAKVHEIRRCDDRTFAEGEVLVLMEYDPDTKTYSGRQMQVRVLYVTQAGEWGLPDNLCVFSLRVLTRMEADGTWR